MRQTLTAILAGSLVLAYTALASAQPYNPASNPEYTRQCNRLAATQARGNPPARGKAEISYYFTIPLNKSREIFPGITGYIQDKKVETEFKTYYFYRKPSTKRGWDMVVVQGPGDISQVYIKNGGVKKENPNILNEHDVDFWFMPNLLRMENQPSAEELKEKLKKWMGWSNSVCGVEERKRFEGAFNSSNKK